MTRAFAEVFLAVLAVQSVATALADEAVPSRTGGRVFGYLDPRTDIFTPEVTKSVTTAAIMREGTLIVTANIAFDPSIPPTISFFASVQASAGGAPIAVDLPQAGAAKAAYSSSVSISAPVERTGNTAKVTLTLPYVFTVSSPSDVVTISFEVFSSTGGGLSSIQKIPLPADGATTTVKIVQKV